MADVNAYSRWPTNAHLIADVAKLWYEPNNLVLDATYGRGTWWKKWRPGNHWLWTNDADPTTSAEGHWDFRDFPGYLYDKFDIVCYDPPYKLNGRPSEADVRYGCGEMKTVSDRMALIYAGYHGCRKVCKPGGLLWVKVMDQVVSGNVVWQTNTIFYNAISYGDAVLDRFDMVRTPRPQKGEQVHARRNGSTLLVIEKNPHG